MRPLKLTVSAFGPYSNVQEFDLDKFGNKGIYLITGDTGSGKTTIFDGIIYALYGEVSGDFREVSSVRNTNADDSVPTYVQLEFENKGKIYKIKRIPDQYGLGKKGNRNVKINYSVELTLEDNTVIDKTIKETNAKIVDIIGLERNQFNQIAMLAQGEFIKILKASTDDRQKIFREIFNTSKFENIQNKLKENSIELKKQCDKLKDSINIYLSNINIPTDSLCIDKFNSIKNNSLPMAEIVEELTKLNNEDEINKDKLNNEYSIVDKTFIEKNSTLNKIKDLDKTKIKLEDSNKELQLLKSNIKEIESNYNKIEFINNDNKVLSESKTKLELLVPIFNEIKTNENKLNTYIKDSTNLKNSINNIEIELKNNTEQLSKLQLEEKVLDKANIEIVTLEKELSDLTNIKNKCNNLIIVNDRLLIIKDKESKAKQEYINYKIKLDEAVNIYNNAYKSYFDSQAGIIASNLESNTPCPVCGSLNHPNLAILSENDYTSDDLDKLSNKVDIARKEVEKLSLNASNLNTQYNTEYKSYLNEYKLLFKDDNISIETINNKLEITNKSINDINLNISKFKDDQNKLSTIRTSIDKTKQLIDKSNILMKDRSNELSTLNANINNLTNRIKEDKTKLNYESIELLNKEINELNNNIRNNNNLIKTYTDSYNNYNLKLNKLDSEIKAYEELLKSCESIDIDKLTIEVNELNINRTNISNNLDIIKIRLETNTKVLKSINNTSEKLIEIEKQYVMVKNLSDTANGTLTSKDKIKLETYVQMGYFERIINKANIRFMKMSDGRYELRRRVESSNVKKAFGLDLDVLDHSCGSIRAISSLSGGESFKAALSLSLGLADEIQELSGGIELGTMFIDEGFGSLDDESLRQAIKTLSNISENNKLIGIISHVNELKDKISNKIIITKNVDGTSSASINIG